MSNSKLYQLTTSQFELPIYVDLNGLVKKFNASNIPMMHWPDGRQCLPANIYMFGLYQKGLSRKHKGGTLLIYAANITHLLRYCFNNKIELIKLTDNQFTLFIKMLQGERRSSNPNVLSRDANSVISIGRNCLDFLSVVGRVYHNNLFVSPQGQIKGIKKEAVISLSQGDFGSRKIVRGYWYHVSFPTPDSKKKRLPISNANIAKIREAVYSSSNTTFQRKRRYVMIQLLEVTGGRRSEISSLKVEDVYKAYLMPEPMLKLLTAKKPGGRDEFRLLPIAKHDLEFLIQFIEINRSAVIRKTIGAKNDDGILLISETSGMGLRPNTITQELSTLAKAADVKEQACPHMFRHRYITKLFVALIEQHNFDNIDEFRRSLLNTESLKQKIQQFTGHANLSSLDIYIHLAFDEITNFKKSYNIVNLRMTIESFRNNLNQFQDDAKNQRLDDISTSSLLKLVEALGKDLERLDYQE